MLKKLLIVGLILCGFLVASVSTVVVADEEKSFTDPTDDVVDIDGDVASKPNIDIIEIDYVRENTKVTLTLTVKGNIENKGDIGIFENTDLEEDSFNLVYYAVTFSTSDPSYEEHLYEIIYINKEYNFTIDSEEFGKLIDFSYDGSTLTLIFDLKNQDEKYAGLVVEAVDMSSLEIYMDEFYDVVEELDVEINAPSTGKVGQSIDFSATVSGEGSYEYGWDFDGDLEIDSTDENPTYIYNEPGTYDVTLFVSDSEDRQGYDYVAIAISEDGTSNGGSTNGDNQGDSNNAILLFAAIIAIIVIIGVIILVVIIRR